MLSKLSHHAFESLGLRWVPEFYVSYVTDERGGEGRGGETRERGDKCVLQWLMVLNVS